MSTLQTFRCSIYSSLLASLIFLQACKKEDFKPWKEYVLVGNRNAGNVSIIDADAQAVIDSIVVRDAVKGEPMYIVYRDEKIFVGDRANSNVHVYDAYTKAELKTIPCGRGVFHMWADLKGKQLWVNNDIDFSITVIDIPTLSVIKTVPIGLKPHDVVLSADGKHAFVTIFSGDVKTPDSVFQYSTKDFEVKAKAAVGKDPHLGLWPGVLSLYVPCQSGSVFVLNQNDLGFITSIPVPNAHGAYFSPDGKIFYTTNIAGGGTDALWAIHTGSNRITGSPVNTPEPTPHNIVVNAKGTTLFITHSGAASKAVSVFNINHSYGTPKFIKTVTADLNPFAIASYKIKEKD